MQFKPFLIRNSNNIYNNKKEYPLWHPFTELFARYLQLLTAAIALWLLVGSGLVMAQPSWFTDMVSPFDGGLRQFSLSAGRIAIVMALFWLAIAPKVSTSVALLLSGLLTIPQLAEGSLALLWRYGGEFSVILLIPLLLQGLSEKIPIWIVALFFALFVILVVAMFTETPLLLPPEAKGAHDAFVPLPQGGWPAIVMALIATGVGIVERTTPCQRGAPAIIARTIRLSLWLVTVAITMPVFWQKTVTLAQVREGQEIFDSGDCSDCHSYQTGFRGTPQELPRLPGLRRLVDLTFVHQKFTRESMLQYLTGHPPPGMKAHKLSYDKVFTEGELRQLAEFLLYIRALPSESGIDSE